MNYYNEIDPKAATWLRELMAAGLIPKGTVDERSIVDVRPDELRGYTQCHFFAGIGGWSLALRIAGLPDDFPAWSGSCPCQPFSAAGAGEGTADARHLWPVFAHLIRECRPALVFGEQVASALVVGKAGQEFDAASPVWLDGVRFDLEGMDYSFGACDVPAAGVGAPHIRQRVYWVAHAGHEPMRRSTGTSEAESGRAYAEGAGCGAFGRMADSAGLYGPKHEREPRRGLRREAGQNNAVERGGPGGLGDVQQQGLEGYAWDGAGRDGEIGQVQEPNRPACASGHAPDFWSSFDILPCLDGKARRVESGTFPLVNGLPRGMVPSGDPSLSEVQATAEGRVMRLKGYGNAISPPLAAAFIEACMDAVGGK